MKLFACMLPALLGLMLATSPALAADRLTVLLDWFVNPDHGPLIVAREKGFFTAEDLEVELIAPADPNDPPKLVAARQADLAVSYQPQLHLQVAQGLPLVRSAITGISAVIDGKGRVLASLPLNEAGVIEAPLPPALAPTPYALWGDGPALLLIALLAVGALWNVRRIPGVDRGGRAA